MADADRRWRVILLPGGVLPAELAYRGLIEKLGESVEPHIKDLEVYATDTPPEDYSIETEMAGISRIADEAGIDRFHLVGYSGGGAAGLSYTAAHSNRVLSLALFEPAWAGNEELTLEEKQLRQRFQSLRDEPPGEFMANFMRYQLGPGVAPPPPPPGPPPEWMAKRPAGLAALMRAFDAAKLDLDALRGYYRPVYFGLGGLSNPDYYARMSERLRGIFRDFTLEVYPGRHHFDPPHRIEPDRVAASLKRLWSRADPLIVV